MSKQLGQYFTTSLLLQTKLVAFILNSDGTILEPSFGRGHLIQAVLQTHPNAVFDCYEIDTSLEPIFDITKHHVYYEDFLANTNTNTYNTIIGNPPYVKGKRNLYIDFIVQCYHHLKDNGEMIMIVPSDTLPCADG